MTRLLLILLGFSMAFSSCRPPYAERPSSPEAHRVEIVEQGSSFALYRNGTPYYIKGAGGHQNFDLLAASGGNSLRTWNTQQAQQTLDKAQSLGLTVTLGLEVGRQWWGQDFDYLDPRAVDEKIEELRKVVLKYKDHPALLMWGVGNEVHLYSGDNTGIWVAINRIAQMIHETDPNHPTATVVDIDTFLGQKDKIKLNLLCTDIDVLAINVFGQISEVYDCLKDPAVFPLEWNRPYIISEWASPGPWESPRTEWEVPVELSSTQKAAYYRDSFRKTIGNDTTRCLGSYTFYWGEKFERTQTFFSIIDQAGYRTEAVEALQEVWSGSVATNRAPRITDIRIGHSSVSSNVYLSTQHIYRAELLAQDPDQDSLYYHWEVRHEGRSDNDARRFNYPIDSLIRTSDQSTIIFQAPPIEGAYRLMAYVYDTEKHVATVNVPFYVIND